MSRVLKLCVCVRRYQTMARKKGSTEMLMAVRLFAACFINLIRRLRIGSWVSESSPLPVWISGSQSGQGRVAAVIRPL